MPERIQRIIARAGITSRRKAEILMTEGRVTVNGLVVTELGSKADASSDTVCVDGNPVRPDAERRYFALHKPKGCVTTTSDPQGRPTVMDLFDRGSRKGLFPVGRLDYNTEGLLLITDDGDFTQRITAAKHEVPKVYHVKVSGCPTPEAVQRLRDGIRLDGWLARPQSVRLLRLARNPWYEVTLVGGRNRQIHRMFQRIGHLVEKIRRVSIGRLTLRGLEPRQVRALTGREVKDLLAGGGRPAHPVELPKPRRRKRRSGSEGGTRRRSRGTRGSANPSRGRYNRTAERPGQPRRADGRGNRQTARSSRSEGPNRNRRYRSGGPGRSERGGSGLPRGGRGRPARPRSAGGRRRPAVSGDSRPDARPQRGGRPTPSGARRPARPPRPRTRRRASGGRRPSPGGSRPRAVSRQRRSGRSPGRRS